MQENSKLYIETPLLESKSLSDSISRRVYLKLENVQPCNSFKIRGMSELCLQAIKKGSKGFVTFSGGNAGITLAYLCYKWEMPCHIFVPKFVSSRILERFKFYGAAAHVANTGKDAYDQAIDFANKNLDFTFVHPYDDPLLWKGYSGMITEIKTQLSGQKPSTILVSVGGGGLLMGIISGLKLVGWEDVTIVAMETIGAHSFNKSIKAGEIIENYPMTSIARTLGAPAITPALLMEVVTETPIVKVISATMTDSDAVQACLQFADDHSYLVEPACGVTLAAIYQKKLLEILPDFDSSEGPIVAIVCGGTDCNVQILQEYAEQFGLIQHFC